MDAMPKKKHHIRLSAEERGQLETILRYPSQRHRQRAAPATCAHAAAGRRPRTRRRLERFADRRRRAHEHPDARARAARLRRARTGTRARRQGPPERDYPRKLDGKGEAQLLALCCGPAPQGRACWTLRLLAGRLVELEVVDAICHETVRQALKKTNSNRGAKSSG